MKWWSVTFVAVMFADYVAVWAAAAAVLADVLVLAVAAAATLLAAVTLWNDVVELVLLHRLLWH